MAINLTAPLVACQAAAPHLKAAGGGRILNVSSVAALLPIPGLMSYGISKIGLEHLTVDLARILQGDGVAVNCFRIDLAVAPRASSPTHPVWTARPGSPARSPPRVCSGCSSSRRAIRATSRAWWASRAGSNHGEPGRGPGRPRPAGHHLFDGVAPDTDSTFAEPYD